MDAAGRAPDAWCDGISTLPLLMNVFALSCPSVRKCSASATILMKRPLTLMARRNATYCGMCFLCGYKCGWANIVVIKLALLCQRKTVAQIEAVGIAPAQRAHPHREPLRVGLRKDMDQYGGTHTLALVTRLDVEVVQQQSTIRGLEHVETDARFALNDV